MTDNELLLAISNIVRKNTEYLEARICGSEERLDNKIDSVEKKLNDKIDEADKRLSYEIRKINLKLENDIEPRLQNIEDCYLSTFERYKAAAEKTDKMQMDIEILQDVVKEHGESIQGMIA